jgi:hypothetical protein
MKRREFLVGTAAGAAGVAALSIVGRAQAPAAGQAPPTGGRQAAPAGRGRGGPANVPAEKLARIQIMSLNHGSMLKLPWNTTPSPTQTIELFDLPQFYIDQYGVRNVEFQHTHLVNGTRTPPDPAFFKELKAKFDAVGSKANQINMEIGQMTAAGQDGKPAALSGEARAEWLALAKKWADTAPALGIVRLMCNQGQLTAETKAGVASLWKELQDYAKPKGLKISNETRGGGPVAANGMPPPARGGAPAKGAPAKAAPAGPTLTGYQQAVILEETAEAAGGYTNLDFGGDTRFLSQKELNDAIKMMLKTNSGQMHIKSCENWDIGLAVKHAEANGFRGLYSIEVNPDPAIRIVYNTILAALA